MPMLRHLLVPPTEMTPSLLASMMAAKAPISCSLSRPPSSAMVVSSSAQLTSPLPSLSKNWKAWHSTSSSAAMSARMARLVQGRAVTYRCDVCGMWGARKWRQQLGLACVEAKRLMARVRLQRRRWQHAGTGHVGRVEVAAAEASDGSYVRTWLQVGKWRFAGLASSSMQ